jgi:hypothetical protein
LYISVNQIGNKDMKRFTLRVFGGPNVVDEIVEAEAHTLENGMIIFWVKNLDDAWAQVAMYPSSCTAIIRFEDVNPIQETTSQMTNMPINITADVQEVIKEIKASTKRTKK